jgi:molecular chaperone DnaK
MGEGRTENTATNASGTTVQTGSNSGGIHFHQNLSGQAAMPVDGPGGRKLPLISRLAISVSRTGLLNGLSGGRNRRVRRAEHRLEIAFAGGAPPSEALVGAGRLYRGAMRLALILQPELAMSWFRTYDHYFPAERYLLVFQEGDTGWLAWLVETGDLHVSDAVFELATRMRLRPLQVTAREHSADLLRQSRDGAAFVRHYQRWLAEGLLDEPTITRSIRRYLEVVGLEQDRAVWEAFFHDLPEALQPDHFEVHCFLGRGVQAVERADTDPKRLRAVQCCLFSPRLDDVDAGLRLARDTLRNQKAARLLAWHAGDLLRSAGELSAAAERYREADRDDLASVCYQKLGRFVDAIRCCPPNLPDRLVTLAVACQPDIDSLAGRREFIQAVSLADELLGHLARASGDATQLQSCRQEITTIRGDLISAARRYFTSVTEQPASAERRAAFEAWSTFEEACGDLAVAAQRAEDGEDYYRASRLFRRAGRFGDADRVLQGERTPQALASRAEAREAGGDLVGAARFYEDCGQVDHAVELFIRAGQLADAARSLVQSMGEEAIDDPRLAQCLRRTGAYDDLVTRCLRAVERAGLTSPAARELRALRDERVVPARLLPDVQRVIGQLEEAARRPFESRAQAWITQARRETDQRFSRIWGLDLGTTTCVAAIYDTKLDRPVLCEWRGSAQFAATLSVDREDNEVIGLDGEEILASWVIGCIASSKRTMGTSTKYRVRGRSYHSEEVAARFIRHARGMVEALLTTHVRERVIELARAELGEIKDEWIAWADKNHNLRIDRPRVLVTIPAYFTNNQKDATRAACVIAGVDLVRLIHEPTAACMAAARERGLAGRVVVVDLGAGTLDVSLLEVEDRVHEVRKVLGNNKFGGNDFDVAVTQALRRQLARDGIERKMTSRDEKRLSFAAEKLKIALSAQPEAEYSLVGFVGQKSVQLSLTIQDLSTILAGPLKTLRDTCREFKESLGSPADHLVLVGRPMKSPLVQDTITEVFGIRRTLLSDPLTAVASGAALQAAVLDGKLREVLLLDVTPLALGIRAKNPKSEEDEFSVLIEANTRIPATKENEYTTHKDDQTSVTIAVFNGQLGSQSEIGQFNLNDIRPRPRGEPQIAVSFSIDASCVLTVTAKDMDTGKSNAIEITDTTLLSPGQIAAMARSYEAERLRTEQRAALERSRQRLRDLVSEARVVDVGTAWQEFTSRKAAYRATSAPLDTATERTLIEIFTGDNHLHMDLELIGRALPQATAKAEAYLDEAEARELGDDLATAQQTEAELSAQLDRARLPLATVAMWTSVLTALAMTDPDPVRRFRNQYHAGSYHAAIEALHEMDGPLRDAVDIERQLHCLSETGNSADYRTVLLSNAGLLHAYPLTSEGPQGAAGNVTTVLARVSHVLPDGSYGERDGFVIGKNLVATIGHGLTDCESVHVRLGTGVSAYGVEDICRPESAAGDVAVLKLTESPAGSVGRCGYPKSVRIGDRVWAFSATDTSSALLIPGLVDMIQTRPDGMPHAFQVGMEAGGLGSGGPLFNDLGEVIGILTLADEDTDRPSGSVLAFTCDILRGLPSAAP